MTSEKDTITVIVNGRPYEVEANENAAVASVIDKALEQSGNTGQPPENWELKDESGNPIDPKTKVRDLVAGVTLFLSPRAGIGG